MWLHRLGLCRRKFRKSRFIAPNATLPKSPRTSRTPWLGHGSHVTKESIFRVFLQLYTVTFMVQFVWHFVDELSCTDLLNQVENAKLYHDDCLDARKVAAMKLHDVCDEFSKWLTRPFWFNVLCRTAIHMYRRHWGVWVGALVWLTTLDQFYSFQIKSLVNVVLSPVLLLPLACLGLLYCLFRLRFSYADFRTALHDPIQFAQKHRSYAAFSSSSPTSAQMFGSGNQKSLEFNQQLNEPSWSSFEHLETPNNNNKAVSYTHGGSRRWGTNAFLNPDDVARALKKNKENSGEHLGSFAETVADTHEAVCSSPTFGALMLEEEGESSGNFSLNEHRTTKSTNQVYQPHSLTTTETAPPGLDTCTSPLGGEGPNIFPASSGCFSRVHKPPVLGEFLDNSDNDSENLGSDKDLYEQDYQSNNDSCEKSDWSSRDQLKETATPSTREMVLGWYNATFA